MIETRVFSTPIKNGVVSMRTKSVSFLNCDVEIEPDSSRMKPRSSLHEVSKIEGIKFGQKSCTNDKELYENKKLKIKISCFCR